jgi:hypothetical protein
MTSGVGGPEVRLLGENCYRRVAYDLNTLVDASVIDVDNVAAGNGEDMPNAFLLQHFGDDLAARNHLLDRGGFSLGSCITAVSI